MSVSTSPTTLALPLYRRTVQSFLGKWLPSVTRIILRTKYISNSLHGAQSLQSSKASGTSDSKASGTSDRKASVTSDSKASGT